MKKIAVILWIYHNDLTKEFVSLLNNTSDIFDIYLCFCEDNNNSKSLSCFSVLSNVKSVNFYPNIGADIYSFIDQITSISDKQYDYFIKAHSKKSRWGINNVCNWRAMLLDSLLGNKNEILRNVNIMTKYQNGISGCCPLIYDNSESNHKTKISEVLDVINFKPRQRRFVGGNMFMGDLRLYKKHIDPYQQELKYFLQQEHGKVNEKSEGNYCHAIERILGYIGCETGLSCTPIKTMKVVNRNPRVPRKFLHLRPVYNNDIYCINQPNIYGRISKIDQDGIDIIWNQKQNNILAKYKKIAKNKYINQIHLDHYN